MSVNKQKINKQDMAAKTISEAEVIINAQQYFLFKPKCEALHAVAGLVQITNKLLAGGSDITN